jgi:hypothetical protein
VVLLPGVLVLSYVQRYSVELGSYVLVLLLSQTRTRRFDALTSAVLVSQARPKHSLVLEQL